MKISREDALRLSAIYTPDSLPARLAAFTPSRNEDERRERIARARECVKRITFLQAANEDEECSGL